MSEDTPRTDAAARYQTGIAVDVEFAKQLEHELNEAKAQYEKSDTERRAFIADLEGVITGLRLELEATKQMVHMSSRDINRLEQDRDRWRECARELARELAIVCPRAFCPRGEFFPSDSLARFNELEKEK
jgi:chromosome segregation ATPase